MNSKTAWLFSFAGAAAVLTYHAAPASAFGEQGYHDMCKSYAEAEDWRNAFFYCRESAYTDDIDSRIHYAKSVLYTDEGRTQQTVEEALRLIRKAAEEGNSEAYIVMGRLRQLGNYPDYKEALTYFMQAYEMDDKDAIVHIGMLYYSANKLNDAAKAREWFIKGSEKNIPEAQYGLGLVLYEQGRPEDAAEEFAKAAKNGDPQAMIAMARFFTNGIVYRPDKIKAIRWLKMAIKAGREDVRPELTKLLSDIRDEERLRLLREKDQSEPELDSLAPFRSRNG